MKNSSRFSRSICVLVAGVFALGLTGSVLAGNTWTGGGTDNNWLTANNWGGATPAFGTASFNDTNNGKTTVNLDGNYNMNQLLWSGTNSWNFTNTNSAVMSLFDNGGVQAKVENDSTGSLTISAPITFAANNGSPPNPFGEINAVNGGLTFNTGTLTVNGSSVNGIKLFGSGQTVTFNNTISAGTKWFGFTTGGAGNTVVINGTVTSGDWYVMNGGTLNIGSTGNMSAAAAIRLGGDFGNTGNQDQTKTGTLQLIATGGGQTFTNVINSTSGNTSGTLAVNALNTSGSDTLSGHIALDSALRITEAAGTGTLNITGVKGGDNTTGNDIKAQTETFVPGAGSTINHSGTIYNSTGSGNIVLNGAGTLILSGSNTYSGTTTISNGTLSAGNIVGATSNIGNAPTSAVVLGGASTAGTLSYTGAAATYVRGFTVNAGGGGLTNAGTGLLQLGTLGTTVASGGTLTFATNANGIQDNSTSVISGLGSIALNSAGAGPLTLLAANTYSGGTTLSSGTLVLGIATVSGATITSSAIGTGTFHIGSGTNSANVQTNVTSGTVRTLNNNISLDGDATFSTSAASGAITFDTIGSLTTPNSITLTRTNQLTVNNAVTLQLGGLVQGSTFGFTELGAGTINLGGGTGDTTNNTYSGLTTVTGGTLALNKATGTNAVSGDLTINGGTVNYGTARDEQIANSAKVTISSGSFVMGARAETIGQVATPTSGLAVSGTGAITILGGGTLTLNNSASMTGGTITLGSATARVLLNTDFALSGGTIDANNATTGGNEGLRLQGGTGTGITYSASGTSTAVISNSGGGGATLSLNTAAGANTIFNIGDGAAATDMNISMPITGGSTNTLQKTGLGTLQFSGTQANTYTGLTTVSQGELDLNKTGALAMGGNLTISGGTVKWLQSNQLATTANIILSSGTLNLNGQSQTVNDLNNSGGNFMTGAGTWTGTGASMTWGGGTNTVNTGGTVFENHLTITSGTNEIQSGGLVQLSMTGLTMNGGTVTIDAGATPGKLALMSNVVANDGTTSNILSSSQTNPGVVDLSSQTHTFTVGDTNAATTLNVSASIINGGLTLAGNGTLAGAGSLVLTGNNTYTGATTVSAGTLNAAAAGALGGTSSVTVNSSGTVLLSGSGNLDRVNNAAGISLAGGTFARTGTASEGTAASTTNGGVTHSGTSTTGLGALTLTSTSNLDFGSGGVGTLVFASFTPGGNTLNILNYMSSAVPLIGQSGVDGTDDRLVFATDQSGNLGAFNFGAGTTAIEIALGDGYFEISDITAVPEPSTWAMGALALCALVYVQRRRFQRKISCAQPNRVRP